jgi:hypothetical protein
MANGQDITLERQSILTGGKLLDFVGEEWLNGRHSIVVVQGERGRTRGKRRRRMGSKRRAMIVLMGKKKKKKKKKIDGGVAWGDDGREGVEAGKTMR